MKYFILCAIFGLILTAEKCENSKQKSQTSNSVENKNETIAITETKTESKATANEDDLVIYFEKTPCYGRCPTFKAYIFGNGLIRYNGTRFVDNIGLHEGKMSLEDIGAIILKADSISFFQMKEKYDSNITDVPSTITSIKKPDMAESKKVTNRAEGPKELKTLEKFIFDKIKTLQLTKVEGAD